MKYDNFPELLKKNLFNDAEVIFEDGKMNVSRLILAGHCKYFLDLFVMSSNQLKVHVSTMKLTDFKVYYEFIHMGDDFQIDGDKLVSLLAIYLKLGLVDIESRLEGWISDDKVLKHQSIIYESCYKANLVQYSNLSKDLISTNFDVLYEIGAFDSLERDPFINLLDLDFIINKNQYLILDVITRWVEFEFQKRKMDWLHLITFINFQKIETKNLKEYMKINTNIYINPEMSLFFVNQLAEKIPEECIDQRKVDALENIYEAPTRIPSNMGNSNYSKMMLFGGTKDGNAVITIDVNQMTVTKERQLLYAKSRHCSERIENQVFVLGDFKNANIEKYDLSGNRNNSVLSFGMSSKKENYGSVLISDKIYVLAGYQDKRKIDIVEYLDPEKMTWIKESDLLDMASCPASVVVDNVMYVASKNRCNKIQRYDYREGEWRFLSSGPLNSTFSEMTSFGKTITCIGGTNYKRKNQIYDIRNNRWYFRGDDLKYQIFGSNAFENKSSIVVSGRCDSFTKDHIQLYNKSLDEWKILKIRMPKANFNSSKIVL